MGLQQIGERLLDILYPPSCVSCQMRGEWWCWSCRERVESPSDTCVPPQNVDALVVTGYYHDPRLRVAIHALKYLGLTQLRREMGEYLRAFVARDHAFPWPREIALQAIPTSLARVRARGFDQAILLAELLMSHNLIGSARVDLLTRTGGNMAQTMLASPELRAANLKGIFSIKSHQQIPREVILVDDVVTTGSTMCEAARVLRVVGVERVYGFALALGK